MYRVHRGLRRSVAVVFWRAALKITAMLAGILMIVRRGGPASRGSTTRSSSRDRPVGAPMRARRGACAPTGLPIGLTACSGASPSMQAGTTWAQSGGHRYGRSPRRRRACAHASLPSRTHRETAIRAAGGHAVGGGPDEFPGDAAAAMCLDSTHKRADEGLAARGHGLPRRRDGQRRAAIDWTASACSASWSVRTLPVKVCIVASWWNSATTASASPALSRVLVREREAGRVDDPGIGAFLGVHGCLTPRVGSIRATLRSGGDRSRRDHLAARPRNRVRIKPTLSSRPRTPAHANP